MSMRLSARDAHSDHLSKVLPASLLCFPLNEHIPYGVTLVSLCKYFAHQFSPPLRILAHNNYHGICLMSFIKI